MHVCIYVYMCVYVSMSVCVYMCIYTCVCVFVCVYELTSDSCAFTTLEWLTKDIQDTLEQAQSVQPYSDSCKD